MSISRREFLKLAGLTLGAAVLRPDRIARALPDVPQGTRLGRINQAGKVVEMRSQPHWAGSRVRTLYEDELVVWQREVVGPAEGRFNQRWVETPEGYLYASFVQPVENRPNSPLSAIPAGQSGFWAEVTVPYVDLLLDNPPARSPWVRAVLESGGIPRLYYTQVVWIDQIKSADNGVILYRFNEDLGHGFGYGDIFWAEGAAFRPLEAAELTPLSPGVDPAEKKIVVSLYYQTLSCFEGNREVFFCRVSTGAKWDAFGNPVDSWSTPPGENITSRKDISVHMAGGTLEGGYDTPAVSWTTFFATGGIAIHAAFWHNDFGTQRSHGCVNCRPEDAKWIFRWSLPSVDLAQGMVESPYPPGGTHVFVREQ